MPSKIKVSEIPEYIDKIQTGGNNGKFSNSIYNDCCVLVIEYEAYGTVLSCYVAPSPLFTAYDSHTDRGKSLVLCVLSTKSSPQQITISGQYQDGESPETYSRSINYVNLSKPGLFYYIAK